MNSTTAHIKEKGAENVDVYKSRKKSFHLHTDLVCYLDTEHIQTIMRLEVTKNEKKIRKDVGDETAFFSYLACHSSHTIHLFTNLIVYILFCDNQFFFSYEKLY